MVLKRPGQGRPLSTEMSEGSQPREDAGPSIPGRGTQERKDRAWRQEHTSCIGSSEMRVCVAEAWRIHRLRVQLTQDFVNQGKDGILF